MENTRVREAATLEDLDEVCRIQREVWDLEDLEIVGRIQLKAVQHAGGSVLIAETEDGAIAGFAYALPARADGECFWHSDMLAVRPRFRSSGLGQALKWAQREAALARGVDRITWTFDPMQAGNAHLNLQLLGATAKTYLENFYGVTTSALHHGLPTDRLLACWDLTSSRVLARSKGESAGLVDEAERIPIPLSWNERVKADPDQARGEQRSVGAALRSALARGLVLSGFDKAAGAYVLTHG